MSVPLSDTRLAAIRERAADLYESSLPENLPAEAVDLAGEDVPDLLAEIDRLRGALAEIASFCKLPHETDFDCPSTVAKRALGAGQ